MHLDLVWHHRENHMIVTYLEFTWLSCFVEIIYNLKDR